MLLIQIANGLLLLFACRGLGVDADDLSKENMEDIQKLEKMLAFDEKKPHRHGADIGFEFVKLDPEPAALHVAAKLIADIATKTKYSGPPRAGDQEPLSRKSDPESRFHGIGKLFFLLKKRLIMLMKDKNGKDAPVPRSYGSCTAFLAEGPNTIVSAAHCFTNAWFNKETAAALVFVQGYDDKMAAEYNAAKDKTTTRLVKFSRLVDQYWLPKEWPLGDGEDIGEGEAFISGADIAFMRTSTPAEGKDSFYLLIPFADPEGATAFDFRNDHVGRLAYSLGYSSDTGNGQNLVAAECRLTQDDEKVRLENMPFCKGDHVRLGYGASGGPWMLAPTTTDRATDIREESNAVNAQHGNKIYRWVLGINGALTGAKGFELNAYSVFITQGYRDAARQIQKGEQPNVQLAVRPARVLINRLSAPADDAAEDEEIMKFLAELEKSGPLKRGRGRKRTKRAPRNLDYYETIALKDRSGKAVPYGKLFLRTNQRVDDKGQTIPAETELCTAFYAEDPKLIVTAAHCFTNIGFTQKTGKSITFVQQFHMEMYKEHQLAKGPAAKAKTLYAKFTRHVREWWYPSAYTDDSDDSINDYAFLISPDESVDKVFYNLHPASALTNYNYLNPNKVPEDSSDGIKGAVAYPVGYPTEHELGLNPARFNCFLYANHKKIPVSEHEKFCMGKGMMGQGGSGGPWLLLNKPLPDAVKEQAKSWVVGITSQTDEDVPTVTYSTKITCFQKAMARFILNGGKPEGNCGALAAAQQIFAPRKTNSAPAKLPSGSKKPAGKKS